MIALAWIRARWRPVAVVLLVLLAFAVGRYTVQAKTKEVEKVVYRDRVVTKTITIQGKQRIVYRDRTVITKPDGTVEKRDISSTDTRQTSSVATQKAETETKASLKVKDAPLAQTRVGALVGLGVRDWKPAYGAEVQRRIAGPVWIGAWGLTSMEFGVSLGLEF